MFDKKEYLNEIELIEKSSPKKTRQIIHEILNTLSKLSIDEIDSKEVNNIISNSDENINLLFLSKKDSSYIYDDLMYSLEVCLNYWDDGRFDKYKRHFEKFVKIKLDL